MLTIEKIDTNSKKQVERFVSLPYRLYANHPQWVPPLRRDTQLYLNRQKHFFYEHSEADFFMAARDDRDVGRIAMLDHRLFNDYHNTCQAQFYLFECEDDQEAATALFEQAFAWAKNRGLNKIIGPKGFSVLDPFGILVEGFEHRQMMTMSNYNYPYYQNLVETVGFVKEVDFSSYYLNPRLLRLPAWVHDIAERTRQKGELQVYNLRTRYEGLRLWLAVYLSQHWRWGFQNVREDFRQTRRAIETYNQTMVDNWEYYPLPEAEISAMMNELKWIINPRFLKLVTHQDVVVGGLLALPDLSWLLQRARGRLALLSLIDALKTLRRPDWLLLAWIGILPQFRLQGGNVLIFTELEKAIVNSGVQHLELHQIADTAVQVRQDLETAGFKPYKIHRVYVKNL
jgi:hypothetical protein